MKPKVSGAALALAGLLLAFGLIQLAAYHASEPFFNNDETRHVMTGFFFRDVFTDLPFTHLREYATRYYLQYPALGLIVWPPLFYVIEGAGMLLWDTSFLGSRILVGAFGVCSAWFLYRLVDRGHGARTAWLATAIYIATPMIFLYSRRVMLEIPTVAFGLAAMFYATRYLEEARPWDAILAALAGTAAAITRFDGVFYLAVIGVMVLAQRRIDLLRRKEVLAGMAIVVLLAGPVFALTAREFGGVHWTSIKGGAEAGTTSGWSRLWFYPSQLPVQITWATVVPGVIGLVASLKWSRRSSAGPFLAMLGVTYVLFTPIADLEVRHAIYWIPAWAFFAAEGIDWVCRRFRSKALGLAAAGLVVAGTFYDEIHYPQLYLLGYQPAAEYVVSNATSPIVLFDGSLDGDFVYQVRRRDAARRLWILRSDKLLYSRNSGLESGYTEFARTEEDVLNLLFRYDPEYVVMETLRPSYQPPMAARLRNVVKSHPERFALAAAFPVDNNLTAMQGVRLEIYRSLLRNPHPETHLTMDMLGLGQNLGTNVPGEKH